MTAAIDAYKAAYWRGATRLFFREFNPVRGAASFVYTGAGSGAIGATSGQFEVGRYGRKDLHYQVRALVSSSVAISIEGRHHWMGTWSQIATIVQTAAMTKFSIFALNEAVDWVRVGVRAASPAAADNVTIYGGFR